MDDIITVYEPFADAETQRFITDGVNMFNAAATGLPEYSPVNIVLRSRHGDVYGGLLGFVWGSWLQVTALWVSQAARGRGYGARLLAEAEAHAMRLGATGATLDTYSFQARPFYERQGYSVRGTIDGFPPGHARYVLAKALGGGASGC